MVTAPAMAQDGVHALGVGRAVEGEVVDGGTQGAPIDQPILTGQGILHVTQRGHGRGVGPGAIESLFGVGLATAQGGKPTLGLLLVHVEGTAGG
jgi:hypothetical protein